MEKRLPPFWHPCFDRSEGIFLFLLRRRFFVSDLLKGRSPLAFFLHILCPWCRRFFDSGLLKGRGPLAFVLHFLCLFCRRLFVSDLLKGRSPLAFVLRLLCLLCRRFFWFGPFERSKPLGVRFSLIVPFVPNVFLVRTF